MSATRYVLNADNAAQKLHRMALEIAENLSGDDTPLVLIGVRNSGTAIAEIIAGYVREYVFTLEFDTILS